MKRIIMLGLILGSFAACQENEEQLKDYVTFSGTIENRNNDSLMIRTRTFSKTIAVKADGTFSDTLKVEPGFYSLSDGAESTVIYLNNGYDLNMSLNTDEFDESLSFSGIGEKENNYLAAKALKEEELLDRNFSDLTETELEKEFATIESELTQFIDSHKDLDTTIVNQNKRDLERMLTSYKGFYGEMIALKKDLPKGAPSPTWEDYENVKGGTTSLKDLMGKFVYVDVWATWCAPCKAEIPALKELEHDYKDENIAFVSMSIDDDRTHGGSWDKAKEDWKAMVNDMNLGGIQIYAPKGWESDFVKNYRIKGIPRFILIDPQGNIVDASAPRPSDPALRTLLNDLI
ncbi:MAG: TlpA family protein disulfide reductase [Flavobacteriaceae bacterium]|nr:TlpA family protein disulfide reductase [Flavobacteriaceae bacterium]